MNDVNEIQIGGAHYRAAVQHWDFAELNGLGYLEGCATKYATRGRKKHVYSRLVRIVTRLVGFPLPTPLEDYEKAIHFVKKAQALYLSGHKKPRKGRVVVPVPEFAQANGLTPIEAKVVRGLTYWKTAEDLQAVIELLEDMAEAER